MRNYLSTRSGSVSKTAISTFMLNFLGVDSEENTGTEDLSGVETVIEKETIVPQEL